MSAFSQSFFLSDTTLVNLEKQAQNVVTPPTRKSRSGLNRTKSEDDLVEVIEESPTSNCQNYTRSIRERLKSISTQSRRRGGLKRNKSDSTTIQKSNKNNDMLNDNFSEFFKSNINIDSKLAEAGPSKEKDKTEEHINISKLLESDFLYDFSQNKENSANNGSSILKGNLDFGSPFELPVPLGKENEYENIMFADTEFSMDSFNRPISGEDLGIISDFDESMKFEEEKEEIVVDLNNVTFTEQFKEDLVVDEAKIFIDSEMKNCKKAVQKLLNEESVFSQEIKLLNCTNNTSMSVLNWSSHEAVNAIKSSKVEGQEQHSMRLDESKNLRLIANWGLSQSILNEYKKKGIEEMFQWQTDCLSNRKVILENRNLVYSAPTSAGKTLVSEILMIKNVIERKLKALIILPFIAVVREKMNYLQEILSSSGIRVEGFFGGYSPPGGFDAIDVAVCTIEKANSVINRLLEQGKLSSIGIIVVDEIHLISDPSRGYILELLLAKVLYVCKKYDYKIQIVTMSATLPNMELLTKWLEAEFYYTDFRPIELKEMIKIGHQIYDNQMQIVRNLNSSLFGNYCKDQDNVGQLCIETIIEKCSVIVFCPSKDWCEKLCLHLAQYIYEIKKSDNEVGDKIRKEIDAVKTEEVKLQFQNCPTGLDKLLEKTLTYGCAFHHAGLTSDERDIIESSFKYGSLRIIVATSTLSSGVNLPARRVIIRTPLFGGRQMNSLTYKQMIGRAGRKGKDTLGESILICGDATAKVGKDLVCAKLNPISSCLAGDSNSHLKRAILEIIASGVASTKEDLETFLNYTLLCSEKGHNFTVDLEKLKIRNGKKKTKSDEDEDEVEKNPMISCLQFLLEYEFIRIQTSEESTEMLFVSTRLGNACLASSMPPSDGFLLFSELQKSRQCFVLESELHAVYLVTPYSVSYQWQDIDWLLFLDLWEKLPSAMRRVGELVGVRDAFLVKAMRGNRNLDYKTLQVHKRFYTALALQELVNEASICDVAAKYKCTRGVLQSLQQMASTFAGIVTSFCSSLNWNLLGMIVAQFRERLFFGIHQDLMDLMRIPNLNGQRARLLFSSGIKSLVDLANSDVFSIEKILYNCVSFEAENKREDENEYDANKRKSMRNLYITGKAGMTVNEAAKLLINDARQYLQLELGLKNPDWTSTPPEINENIEEAPVIAPESEDLFSQPITNERKRSLEVNKKDFKRPSPPKITRQLRSNSKEIKSFEISSDNSNNSIFHNSLIMNSSSHILSLNKEEASSSNLNQLSIIEISKHRKMFLKFQEELENVVEISVSLGISKLENIQPVIGGNLLVNKPKTNEEIERNFVLDSNCYLNGISFCFDKNVAYFMSMQDEDAVLNDEKIKFIRKLFSRGNFTVNIFDAKEQLKMLMKIIPELHEEVQVNLQDPKLANWLLQPDVEMSLKDMAQQYAPETIGISQLAGNRFSAYSVALNFTSSIDAKIRCSVESCVVLHIIKGQLENISRIGKGEGVLKVFSGIEMPIQYSLSKMELTGFGICSIKTAELAQQMTDAMKKLEMKIYEIHGRKFNLGSSSEVGKVIGLHKNGRGKVSTAKQVLEKIETPIANLIIEYRKISTTLAKTIQPMMRNIKNNRIHGNSFSFTSTGRISMHEPNLQNVAKDFDVEFEGVIMNFRCRNVFKTSSPSRCLLSADFCQLELRILTHLSQDKKLISVMRTEKDVFQGIAAKWNKVNEEEVSETKRNETKQICYGIIYGMGVKSMAETLKVEVDTAKMMIDQFHKTYPEIRNYTDKIIKVTQDLGYIETLTGRRRYFPNINCDNLTDKKQAERQAINTTIQGSAADIAKNAILRMERNLKKYQTLLGNDRVDLVLHLHDELIYEIPTNQHLKIAKILKSSMENCAKLSIPLKVKVKVGPSWGELKELPL